MDLLAQGQRYRYQPLPSVGWTRLLTIDPSGDNPTEISCHLNHYQLASRARYEAISYTWGTEEATNSIVVDGKPFALRSNLLSVIQAIRHRKEPRVVWVDAICINQDDVTEKNQQVRQMDEIYSHAGKVNVWLGAATEGSDRGVGFLQQLHKLVYQDRKGSFPMVGSSLGRSGREASSASGLSGHRLPESVESYNDLYASILRLLDDPQIVSDMDEAVALLSNPWWQRMWTLQESVLCSEVVCWCGQTTFPIAYFYYLATFIYLSVNFNIWRGSSIDDNVSLRTVWRAADLRDHISKQGPIPLSLALDSTWNRKAFDSRDKIIGLLGLVGRRADLKPEYSWPVEEVYQMAMRAALIEEGTLHCLGLISDRPEARNPKLPSWVPDFEAHSEPFSDYITSLSKPIFASHAYNASLRSSDMPVDIATNEDGSILILKGIVVGSVRDIGLQAPGWDLRGANESGSLENSRVGWTLKMRHALDEWRSHLPADEATYLTGETYSQAFWRTVLVDLKQGAFPKPSSAIGPKRLDDQDFQALARLDVPDSLMQLLNTWASCTKPEYRQLRLIEQFSRRFFVTADGRIGLGPPGLRADDIVCVLLGGSVVYALRDGHDGTWTYVGECYVHGIMDGEIIKDAQGGKRSYEVFRIR